MPFPECGISPYDERDLFAGEINGLSGPFRLKLEPAVLFAGHAVFDEDVLDGRRTDGNSVQFQGVGETDASPGGTIEAEGQDTLNHLLRRRHGVALGDRRQILEALNPVRLNSPRALVELAAAHTSLTAGLGDIVKRLGQIQSGKPLPCAFYFGVPWGPFERFAPQSLSDEKRRYPDETPQNDLDPTGQTLVLCCNISILHNH